MDMFEHAMKMEEDGRSFYLQHAEKTNNVELKSILIELAEDEAKHYNIFKAMRDDQPVEYEEEKQTTVLSSVKNVFETMKGESKELPLRAGDTKLWEEAREIEKKAETFYRAKADETDNENQMRILHRIADEEHKHWIALDNIIRFLNRPRQWLENAEWSTLEDY